jgi:superfamily II DNA helicase RecQ
MRLGQLEACFCLLHPHHPNSLVVVHWTGGRKSHILHTLGVIERGIILIFIPLLTLSANVMHKFESADPTWGNVGVYHLDNFFDCNCLAHHQLLCQCSSMKRTTSSTLFLFLSLQFLIHHPKALGVFVTCAPERTLQLIAMDEVHIHVQHGSSFRKEIWALCVEFFQRLYGNQPRDKQPRLIAHTATFPRSYLPILLTLLTVNLSISECILWGTSVEFQQRKIEMKIGNVLKESAVNCQWFVGGCGFPPAQSW